MIRDPTCDPDLAEERPTFVTHLECALTGEAYEADKLHGLSRAGRPLLVRYDLEALAEAVDRTALVERPGGVWRYREFLPLRRSENIVSLGEIATPLIRLSRLGPAGGRLLVKDEGRQPTGSFKARGLCVAVSMAKELGIARIAMPTAGNAGAALAAYATRAGIESWVFCPDDAPETAISETAFQGAKVYRVDGLINDCGKIVGDGEAEMGWFDVSTLKEPYRLEGKKTMGFELAEQLGWELPDVIFYPTGGGTGLIGMWKAFAELGALGWIDAKRPRMVAVQSTGCAPIVDEPWQDVRTGIHGLRVPVAVGDFLILRALRESGGFGIAVSDEAALAAQAEAARTEGLLLCPEGAATLAAYKQALGEGRIEPGERAVLFNCATGLKYPLPEVTNRLDRRKPIDYAAL
jgi:threonine synthase